MCLHGLIPPHVFGCTHSPEGHGDPGTWVIHSSGLPGIIWGIKLGSFQRAVCGLNYWAISQALKKVLLKEYIQVHSRAPVLSKYSDCMRKLSICSILKVNHVDEVTSQPVITAFKRLRLEDLYILSPSWATYLILPTGAI